MQFLKLTLSWLCKKKDSFIQINIFLFCFFEHFWHQHKTRSSCFVFFVVKQTYLQHESKIITLPLISAFFLHLFTTLFAKSHSRSTLLILLSPSLFLPSLPPPFPPPPQPPPPPAANCLSRSPLLLLLS